MPTINKRINLTVNDELYQEIQAFKVKNGIVSDSSACLQLIIQQLRSQNSAEAMLNLMQRLSPEELTAITKEGMSTIRDLSLNQPEE